MDTDNCRLNEFIEPMRQEEWSEHLKDMLPVYLKDLSGIVSIGVLDQQNEQIQLIKEDGVFSYPYAFKKSKSNPTDLVIESASIEKFKDAYVCKVLPKLTANGKTSKTAAKIRQSLSLSEESELSVGLSDLEQKQFKFVKWCEDDCAANCFVMSSDAATDLVENTVQDADDGKHKFQIEIIQHFKLKSNEPLTVIVSEQTFSKRVMGVNISITDTQLEDMQRISTDNFLWKHLEGSAVMIYVQSLVSSLWKKMTRLGLRHNLQDYYMYGAVSNIGTGNLNCTFRKFNKTGLTGKEVGSIRPEVVETSINFPKQYGDKIMDLPIYTRRYEVMSTVMHNIASIVNSMKTVIDGQFTIVTNVVLAQLMIEYCESNGLPVKTCPEQNSLSNFHQEIYCMGKILSDINLYCYAMLPVTDGTILIVKKKNTFAEPGISILVDDCNNSERNAIKSETSVKLEHKISDWELKFGEYPEENDYYAFKVDIEKLEL